MLFKKWIIYNYLPLSFGLKKNNNHCSNYTSELYAQLNPGTLYLRSFKKNKRKNDKPFLEAFVWVTSKWNAVTSESQTQWKDIILILLSDPNCFWAPIAPYVKATSTLIWLWITFLMKWWKKLILMKLMCICNLLCSNLKK